MVTPMRLFVVLPSRSKDFVKCMGTWHITGINPVSSIDATVEWLMEDKDYYARDYITLNSGVGWDILTRKDLIARPEGYTTTLDVDLISSLGLSVASLRSYDSKPRPTPLAMECNIDNLVDWMDMSDEVYFVAKQVYQLPSVIDFLDPEDWGVECYPNTKSRYRIYKFMRKPK